MPRQRRIEYPGAIYHAMSRSDIVSKVRSNPFTIHSIVKTNFVISVLMWGLILASQAFSEVAHRVYPVGSSSNAVEMICSGTNYSPPLPLMGTNSVVDRSSPEKLMESVFTAYRLMDMQLYLSLYGTNQPRISLAPDPSMSPTNMAIMQRIDYGGFSIIIASIKATNSGSVGPFIMKQSGGNLFLSDQLRGDDQGDPTYEFLENTFIQTTIRHEFSTNGTGSANGSISSTNYALGNTNALPFLIVRFNGTNYSPLRPVDSEVAQTNQDLTTPETALDAVYSAARANSTAWYTNLIIASELDAPLDDAPAGCSTMRQCVSNRLERLAGQLDGGFVALRKSAYGPYAILRIRSAEPRPGQEDDWLVFKHCESSWLLTTELNDGDVVLAYLLGHSSMFSPSAAKVFPTP